MKWIPCDICSNSNYRILCVTTDRSFPIGGSFQLVTCSNCGLLYLNPQPEFEELQRHYPTEDYYAYRSGREPTNIVDNEKLALWRTIRDGILKPWSKLLPPLQNSMERELAYLGPIHCGMKILDVGCGVGDGLSFYRERGASTYGVEINPKACEEGRNKGHHIFCGQLFDAGFESEFFDVIRFHQSLEHMFSPKRILLEAYRILKSNGRVWISLPNHDGIHARLFGKWFYAIESPRHLFGFTPSTMARLLTQTGFQMEHLHTHSLPGGPCFSFEYFLNDHINRSKPFYYGQIRVKWWYIAAEPLFFFPRLLVNLFNFGEILVISGRKP
jgi:SAM-dependent methyltransferase